MKAQVAVVLDDIESCRTLLADLLAEKQVQVRAYADPETCLNACKKYKCSQYGRCADFILTDNRMPGMTGLDFLQQTQKMGCRIPDSCKAVISGVWTKEDLELAEKSGYRIFNKPYLIDAIYTWLDECE